MEGRKMQNPKTAVPGRKAVKFFASKYQTDRKYMSERSLFS
jgi:hypothetical protein